MANHRTRVMFLELFYHAKRPEDNRMPAPPREWAPRWSTERGVLVFNWHLLRSVGLCRLVAWQVGCRFGLKVLGLRRSMEQEGSNPIDFID